VVRSCKCLGMELQVVATASRYSSLIVNGNEELYITGVYI
jgi:hypothetical protein